MTKTHRKYFDLCEAFDRHVVDVNAEWMLFRDLFLQPENLQYFDSSGVLAWMHIRDAILEDLIIGIGRLLDPAESCGRPNLSPEQVILGNKDLALSTATQKAVNSLRFQYSKVFREWRNKRVGHNDLAVGLGTGAIPGFAYSALGELIEKLNSVCRKVSSELRGFDVDYVPRISNQNWVPSLMDKLRK